MLVESIIVVPDKYWHSTQHFKTKLNDVMWVFLMAVVLEIWNILQTVNKIYLYLKWWGQYFFTNDHDFQLMFNFNGKKSQKISNSAI